MEFADTIDLGERRVPVDLGEVGGPSVSCLSGMLLVVLRELGGSSVSCLSGVLLVVLRPNPDITGLVVIFGGDLEDLNLFSFWIFEAERNLKRE